jgi:hypothetical protein
MPRAPTPPHASLTEHGARVIVRKWTDYSDQKNFANAQARGPNTSLSMDADEAISAECCALPCMEADQRGLVRAPINSTA